MPFVAPFRRPRLIEARIQRLETGRFTVGRGVGEPAMTVAVPDELGFWWDTAAWPLADPGDWYTAHGRAYVLGLDEILFAREVGADLMLVATPARFVELATMGPWVGPAAVIIDWEQAEALRLALSLVRAVRCDTPELARAVETVLHAAPRRQRLKIKLGAPA